MNIGRSVSWNEEQEDAGERNDTRRPLPRTQEEESDTTSAEKEAEAAQRRSNDEDVAGDEVVKMSDTSQEEMKMPQLKDAIEEAKAPAEKESSLGSKLWEERTKEDAADDDDAIKKSERSRLICIGLRRRKPLMLN
eukprot:scaffold42216_cov427-Skeletonema_dohrnii-CCMP3373.AAC.1